MVSTNTWYINKLLTRLIWFRRKNTKFRLARGNYHWEYLLLTSVIITILLKVNDKIMITNSSARGMCETTFFLQGTNPTPSHFKKASYAYGLSCIKTVILEKNSAYLLITIWSTPNSVFLYAYIWVVNNIGINWCLDRQDMYFLIQGARKKL